MTSRWPTLALALAAAVSAACGDNEQPIDAPPAPRLPDLVLVGYEMADSIVIAPADAAPCELVESCVSGPGPRQLLQFDAIIANRGTADLKIGPPPPEGVSEGRFVWSPCHMHHHVTRFAEYELHDATGVVMAGHKQAFCLEDSRRDTVSADKKFTCDNQGISVGASDVYKAGLPCQWIDVTAVTPGTYTLVVRINPTGELPDSDLTNNEWVYPGIVIGSPE